MQFKSHPLLVGIVGDHPSQYSRSPALWSAAFKELDIRADYQPFDVPAEELRPFVESVRANARFKGFNVTTPHKVAIMDFLDEVDPAAREIGAVNTVVRESDGRLIGFNTDGQGVLDSLIKPWPGQPDPVMNSLAGANVLLLGAGGAARAAAFGLAEAVGPRGRIKITNRDMKKAADLARALDRRTRNAEAIAAEAVRASAKQASLILNATTIGQSGVASNPYSPLAADEASAKALMREIPASAVFFDLIYSPPETRFLADARLSGKKTLNGMRMIVWQAVDAFVNRIMASELGGKDKNQTADRVFKAMSAAPV